jgi:hypothetical protein
VTKKLTLALLAIAAGSAALDAHGVTGRDAAWLRSINGPAIGPLAYLGAKHMVTGYDHLLFLVGVVFFLYKPRHILLYVSLFTIGHSVTLLLGAMGGVHANGHLVDAVIGLSVVYKGFENVGGFTRLGRWAPDSRIAVLVFGLVHGLGLATKLQDLQLSRNGLLVNIVSFNVGVEIGQVIALSVVLTALLWWRRSGRFERGAFAVNAVLMAAGFVLIGYQLAGYLEEPARTRIVQAAAVGMPATPATPVPYASDTTQIELAPYDYVEYKYRLAKGSAMVYAWTASAAVIADFHGAPDGGGDADEVSVDKGTRPGGSGTLTAAFDGMHGWYWENPGSSPITITVTSAGFYSQAVESRSNRTTQIHEVKVAK